MATDEGLRVEAVERLKERRGFYVHLGGYALANLALSALWAITGGGGYWPMWTALGWGIGVAFHGLALLIEGQEMSEARIAKQTLFDASAERRGFLIHLGAYLATNTFLFTLWLLGTQGPYWPSWVAYGWGIGVAVHGVITVLGHRQPREDAVEHEMAELTEHPHWPAQAR